MKIYKRRPLENITQTKNGKIESLIVQRANMLVRGNDVTKLMKQMMKPTRLILKVTETSKTFIAGKANDNCHQKE